MSRYISVEHSPLPNFTSSLVYSEQTKTGERREVCQKVGRRGGKKKETRIEDSEKQREQKREISGKMRKREMNNRRRRETKNKVGKKREWKMQIRIKKHTKEGNDKIKRIKQKTKKR